MIETKKNEKHTPRIETKEEPKKASFRLRTGIKAGTWVDGGKTAADDWEARV